MNGFWREHVVKRLERSSSWPSVRKEKIRQQPYCEVCFTKKNLHVHHCVPFSVNPDMELDEYNLVVLCARCHLLIGHLGHYKSWNPSILSDVMALGYKVQQRPDLHKDSKKKVTLWQKYVVFQDKQLESLKKILRLD